MKKLWLAVGLIAFLLGLIVIALVENPAGPREPEYRGKKLTAWLVDLGTSWVTRTNATLAIQQMGTNAVPFLVQMLHAKDSPLKLKCMELVERQMARQHRFHFHFLYSSQKINYAISGLTILGSDAKGAIPDLVNLLKDGDGADGQMAAFVLSRIGPSAVPALEIALTNSDGGVRLRAAEGLRTLGAPGEPWSVPQLLGALKDPDPVTRFYVAESLQQFPDQANVIVLALTNCLNDPESTVRVSIMRTLGSFGTNAVPAIPNLLKLAADTNEDISGAATEALEQIDRETAAKLNGK